MTRKSLTDRRLFARRKRHVTARRGAFACAIGVASVLAFGHWGPHSIGIEVGHMLFLTAVLWAALRLSHRILGPWGAAALTVLVTLYAVVEVSLRAVLGLHVNRFLLSMLLEGGSSNPIPDALWQTASGAAAVLGLIIYLVTKIGWRPRKVRGMAIAGLVGLTLSQSFFSVGYHQGDIGVLSAARTHQLLPAPPPALIRTILDPVLGERAANPFATRAVEKAIPDQHIAQQIAQQIAKIDARPLKGDKRPHILLITLDSLRADLLQTTPSMRLNAPAATIQKHEDLSFLAASNCTQFSYYSLFYGRPALDFASAREQGEVSPLIARLNASGYDIKSFESESLDWYDTARLIYGPFADRQIETGAQMADRDTAVLGQTLDALRAASEAPLFIHAYLYGTHYPFAAPLADDASLLHRYTDASQRTLAAIQHLIDTLQSEDLFENLLVIVTSDHGEEVGEDGRIGHIGALNDRTLKVPFYVFSSQDTARPFPKTHSDLAPFLFDTIEQWGSPQTGDRPAPTKGLGQAIISAACGYHHPPTIAVHLSGSRYLFDLYGGELTPSSDQNALSRQGAHDILKASGLLDPRP